MQLECYLSIADGRCEEALAFYKSIFGGTYELSRFSERGDDSIPEHWREKIMHSSFESGAIRFMASDGMPGSVRAVDESNVSLSLSNTDVAEGQRIFDALAQGGTVTMPFQDTFWGARFGMLVDRFGINWMVNSRK